MSKINLHTYRLYWSYEMNGKYMMSITLIVAETLEEAKKCFEDTCQLPGAQIEWIELVPGRLT